MSSNSFDILANVRKVKMEEAQSWRRERSSVKRVRALRLHDFAQTSSDQTSKMTGRQRHIERPIRHVRMR